jgi:hypothetical protein
MDESRTELSKAPVIDFERTVEVALWVFSLGTL